MELIISINYDEFFIYKIVNKIIRELLVTSSITNFETTNSWLNLTFKKNDLDSKEIIQFALKHIEIINSANFYKIRFNPSTYYPKTNLRMITLLKAINFGTTDFKGTKIIQKEFDYINKNIEFLYESYNNLFGVVI